MISITTEVSLDGDELAKEFWEKDCGEQAKFFNNNLFMKDNWQSGRAIIQLDWLVSELDDNGIKFIEMLHDRVQEMKDD